MFRFILCLVAITLVTAGSRETHRLIKVQDGIEIAQDIVHEKEENIVTVTVSKTPAYKDMVPTVNFHDFNTKYVVFKDIERGICLLTYAPIPFATPDMYRMKRTNMTLPFKASFYDELIDHEEVERKAGSKISDFCKDYKTFWMDLVPQHNLNTRSSDDPEPCWLFCDFCLVQIDKGYQDAASEKLVG